MVSDLSRFEKITRRVIRFSNVTDDFKENLHPFVERNVHPDIDQIARQLFDDGHYSQATFEAYKFLDEKVRHLSKSNNSGFALMMEAFNENHPKIELTNLSNTSEIDEQKGYKFIFAGAILAIRNPRGHEVIIGETSKPMP